MTYGAGDKRWFVWIGIGPVPRGISALGDMSLWPFLLSFRPLCLLRVTLNAHSSFYISSGHTPPNRDTFQYEFIPPKALLIWYQCQPRAGLV